MFLPGRRVPATDAQGLRARGNGSFIVPQTRGEIVMKRSRLPALFAIALLLPGSNTWANIRLRFPEDGEPPFYNSSAGPALNADGSLFALQDGEWAAIPFYRSPEFAPMDYDLLNKIDPSAFDAPLHVEGFIELTDEGNIFLEQTQGTGAVPIWFLKWADLQAIAADGDLTIGELLDVESLRMGVADFYEHQNHVFGVHPVSHLTVVGHGTLEDGSAFELRAVEVGLELKEITIDFE
jgi:hypothetical protein